MSAAAPVAGAMAILAAGEELWLLPDRAAHWPAASTLLIADPHVGKAATFRAAGVYVPSGTTAATLSRLDALLQVTRARRVVYLGDFLHAREGRHPYTFAALASWRTAHESVEMQIVRGNHDVRAGDLPESIGISSVDGPVREGPFAFVHHPVRIADAYTIAGHVHPGAVLRGAVRQRERLPCFWFGMETAVLPAFGEFTGLADVRPVEGDRVWVIAEGCVIAAPMPAPRVSSGA